LAVSILFKYTKWYKFAEYFIMTKAERTRQYIIEKAAVLFNTKGYADTSLNDIVSITGLTRGAIYGNFTNKDELSIEVFSYHFNLLRRAVGNAMDQESGAVEKLKAMTAFYRQHYAAMAARGGCAILNAATEADDNFPLLRTKVRASIKSWQKALVKILEDGKLARQIQPKLDSVRFSSLLIAMIEGGIMLAKIQKEEASLVLVLDKIDQIIDQDARI